MTIDVDLQRACAALGVETSYRDVYGEHHDVPESTLRAIVNAIGAAGDTAVPRTRAEEPPLRCYEGSPHARARRMFGPAVQLYAVRSRRNWGIGDFTDLGALTEIAAAHGADLVGVNPLHALLPGDTSPYSPSSRTALNPLYLDVEAIDDFGESASAQAAAADRSMRQRIDRLRDAPLVDYAEVAAVKHELFELLYAHFRDHHLKTETARARSFRAFQSHAGEGLRAQALFDALRERLGAMHGADGWPAEYRDPDSPAVAAFARAHAARVEFFEYLQWQADHQLAEVARRSRAAMAIGLYRDLAVGVNAGGAEAWRTPGLFARSMHIGAPPDEFNQGGQDWGLPPWIPQRLSAAGYSPWSAVLRANMRSAGALRIDHVMGLARLFWVPEGASPRDGAYVLYPFDAMLDVLARESQRERCIIVGEDLGTVPDHVRAAMAKRAILSYRVLYFEQDGNGFRAPSSYPADALVTPATHDLPTLAGFLSGADLRARDALGLFPDSAIRERQRELRERDRRGLFAALRDAGIDVADAGGDEGGGPADRLVPSAHAFLARSPSRLMTFQLEDVFGMPDQVNLPSTGPDRYPNWRRKLPLALEDWAGDGRFAATCNAIRDQGRGRDPARPAATDRAEGAT